MLAIMDHSQMRDGYHDDEYSNNSGGWQVGPQGYHSPHLVSPAQEYGGFAYDSSQMPVANVYSGQMQQADPQGQYAPTWPSMLTNQPQHAPSSMSVQQHMAPMSYAPPQPLPPLITTPVPAAPPQPPQSTSRRTLTDHDRRRMCQYHEENPTVKQTEIGAMFGVERSTVSKVLRNKEKYLAQDEGSKSPIRRAKGKFPDIERALTNWATKHQQKGMQLTDQAIRDKARFFAASVGNPEASAKVNTASWLEKFKQKNQMSTGKGKKGANSIASADLSATTLSASPTTSGVSPISPAGREQSSVVGSPRERKKDVRTESPIVPGSRLAHSNSATSLASGYSDSASSFSIAPPHMPAIYEQQLAAMSQAMQHQRHQLAQSQSQSQGQSQGQSQSHMPPPPMTESARPRSQTYPMLGIERDHAALGETYADGQIEDIMAHSAMDTPQDGYPGRSLSVTSLSSADLPHLHHSHAVAMFGTPGMEHSPSVMAPPLGAMHPASATSSNVASPIGAATLDDGKRGLEMAMSFLGTLPTGVVDPQDYMLLGKLMEKLKALSPDGSEMPGGMHSINMQKEMERKRSMQSI